MRVIGLMNLRGKINIYNLEEVKDEEEAKSAKLKEKEIFNLGLCWNSIAVDRYDKDEKVLEGLHPHPNLKSLTIEWYGGKKFPSWVNDLSLFHNLIHIKLNWCVECEEVPTLGHLPCLRVLKIYGMENARSIGSGFYSYSDGSYRNTTTLFPALRTLELKEMYNLKEWKDTKELTSASCKKIPSWKITNSMTTGAKFLQVWKITNSMTADAKVLQENAIETICLLFPVGGTIDYNCKLMNKGGMYILNIERAIFKDKEEAGVGLIIRVAQGLLIAVMSTYDLFASRKIINLIQLMPRTEVLEQELLLPTNNAGGALAFYGKLNGRFLESLSMLDALFLTELKFWNKNCYYLSEIQEVLPFCGKLDGSILEWLLKPNVLFLTGHFARDMESARVVQELQWREFKIDSNEIVSLKFDVSTTPSWVVRLDDDEDEEDPEFYGSPAFAATVSEIQSAFHKFIVSVATERGKQDNKGEQIWIRLFQ
uniref:R13L1/DRL21-like LRR repeat region domain-containing protein n=1 Tax=Quercus lobata TaxID=97700 RepID=A0A7N2RCP4_QUELO